MLWWGGGAQGLVGLVRTFSSAAAAVRDHAGGDDGDLWPGMFLESPLRTWLSQYGAKRGLKNGDILRSTGPKRGGGACREA